MDSGGTIVRASSIGVCSCPQQRCNGRKVVALRRHHERRRGILSVWNVRISMVLEEQPDDGNVPSLVMVRRHSSELHTSACGGPVEDAYSKEDADGDGGLE